MKKVIDKKKGTLIPLYDKYLIGHTSVIIIIINSHIFKNYEIEN